MNDMAVKETVADIALMAGYMLAKGKIQFDDSRQLISDILDWAEEFMLLHEKSDWDTDDYITSVDRFSINKLKKTYGMDR
jgi:hypothetical protein